jgi:8-oxo-dGTP diphosphatase
VHDGPLTVHRVVAALLVSDGQVLLCRRRDDRPWYPGAWDLPGGHLEPDETPLDALARECREELGITVGDVVLLPVATGDPELDLTAFVVHEWEGDPQNLAPEEHERIAWFDADGCRGLPLSDPRLLPVLLRGLAS